MFDRASQLEDLVKSLTHMVKLLHQLPNTPYPPYSYVSEKFLSDSLRLKENGYSQQELTTLSCDICICLGTKGFDDYESSLRVPWAEEFSKVSGEVYKHAYALRIVGEIDDLQNLKKWWQFWK